MARYTTELFRHATTKKYWLALVDSQGHVETDGLVGATRDFDSEKEARAEAERIWSSFLKAGAP
jgi:hypothetical protein